ncbi:hypothetical protein ACJX0J_013311 [Zea mays]
MDVLTSLSSFKKHIPLEYYTFEGLRDVLAMLISGHPLLKFLVHPMYEYNNEAYRKKDAHALRMLLATLESITLHNNIASQELYNDNVECDIFERTNKLSFIGPNVMFFEYYVQVSLFPCAILVLLRIFIRMKKGD